MQGMDAASLARATLVHALIQSTNIYGAPTKLFAKLWDFEFGSGVGRKVKKILSYIQGCRLASITAERSPRVE